MMGFMEGEDGRLADQMTADQRRQGVIDSFVRYFAMALAIRWSTSSRTGWKRSDARLLRRRPWPRRLAQLRRDAARAGGPHHWAGTETATVWNGYMDGAVIRASGWRRKWRRKWRRCCEIPLARTTIESPTLRVTPCLQSG